MAGSMEAPGAEPGRAPAATAPAAGPGGLTPDPKARFTERVEAYVRYRPTYPPQVLDFLRAEKLLRDGMTVADIGSGTGISSAMFLAAGYTVYGVEPNVAMRAAAERTLARRQSPTAPPRDQTVNDKPTFHSIPGSAEATTLPPGSVDLVVAGQAFHWFDRPAAKAEFRRILRLGGGAALFWNTRKLTGSDFAEGYEALLREFGTDYDRVRHDHVDDSATIAEFFSPTPVRRAALPNEQRLDHVGLEGRLLSSSYAPGPGHPRHLPMLEALRRLFDRCAIDGQVVIEYETEVHAGRLWKDAGRSGVL